MEFYVMFLGENNDQQSPYEGKKKCHTFYIISTKMYHQGMLQINIPYRKKV